MEPSDAGGTVALNQVQARAYEDPSDPAGAQVVVVLQDIVRTPVPCAFRLMPAGHVRGSAPPDGWPVDEMVALETRTTRNGVELVLGPEVGGHAALSPGTPVEIALSGTRIRAQFTWPEPAGSQQRRRRNITLVPSRRPAKANAQPAESHASRIARNARSSHPASESAAGTANNQEPAAYPSGPLTEDEPAMSPAPSIFDKLAALDAIAATADTPPTEPPQAGQRPMGDRVTALPQEVRKAREPDLAPAVTPAQTGADPVVAMLAELKRDIVRIKQEQASSLAPREEQHLYGLLADLRRDIEILKRQEAAHEPPPGERQLYGMLAELRRDIESLKRQEADHAFAAGERQLHGMLAELRRDIEMLKRQEAEMALPPSERQLYGMLSELRRDIELLRHHEAVPAVHAGGASAGEAQLYGMLAELRRDIQVLKEHEAEHVAPSPERALYAMLAELKRDIHALQEHGHEPAPQRVAGTDAGAAFGVGGLASWIRMQTQGQSLLSLIAMALVPILAVSMLMNNGSRRAADPGVMPVAQSPALPVAGPGVVRPGEPAAPSPVFDALAAGAISPKGVNATGMPAAEILARINAERQAGQGRLGAEGQFWMKRYLVASLGDANTARVLTQLGSIHAEAGPGADYTKARQLWEIAGALGDPVAMCFLGSLHDSGLGVPADRRSAMQWFERARDAGGCGGAERLPGSR